MTETEVPAPTALAAGAGTDAAPARRGRDLLRVLPAYVPAALILAGGWAHRWSNEDAFINFRVIDNLFAGDGPVFNAGERVEAGTSPLWVALLAVGRLLFGWFVEIEWIAVVLALALAVAAFALAGRAARVAARDGDGAVVPVGPMVVASVAVVWDFATSGLEMSLVWLWIAGCWYVLCRAARGIGSSRRRRAAEAALVGLAPLIRPDLGVMMIVFVAAWFVLVRPRRVVADVGAMFALPVLYQIFRMGYYASVVPSTALAKDAGGLHLGQGWDYLVDFVEPYHLWLPVAVIVATIALRLHAERDRRLAIATAAVLAAAALHAGYIVVVGGDYMHGRLLLPGFFALGLPAWVVVRSRAVPALALCSVAGVWAVLAVATFRPPTPPPGIHMISDWRQLQGSVVIPDGTILYPTDIPTDEIYDRGVRGFIQALEPEPVPGRDPDGLVVTLGSIGIPGYQLGTEVWVVDVGGLAEPLAARTDTIDGRPAGHRKQIDLSWYDARFGVVGDDPEVRTAARALRCGPIEDMLDALTEPMTPGRFLSNVWNSVRYTRLHVAADPADAVAEHCPG
jgi:arabinofuranosyltransferase